MTFLGADTEQVRAHGERCTTAAGRLGELFSSLTSTVQAVQWVGPDAERFRADFDGRVGSSLRAAAEDLRTRAGELAGHADQQDETSGSDGGAGLGGVGGDGIYGDGGCIPEPEGEDVFEPADGRVGETHTPGQYYPHDEPGPDVFEPGGGGLPGDVFEPGDTGFPGDVFEPGDRTGDGGGMGEHSSTDDIGRPHDRSGGDDGWVWENPGPWQRDENGELMPLPGSDERFPRAEDIDWEKATTPTIPVDETGETMRPHPVR